MNYAHWIIILPQKLVRIPRPATQANTPQSRDNPMNARALDKEEQREETCLPLAG